MKKFSLLFFAVAVGLVGLMIAGNVCAALTVSNESASVWGTKRVKIFQLAFDSSYPAGGESLTKASRGMSALDEVIITPKDGYTFVYDTTNEKVKVFAPAPPVVYEEQHTIASNAITLDYPAAYIMAVSQADANLPITDPGATLTTGQCKPTAAFAAGTRSGVTFASALSGVVYVTYVTQAWKEVWDNLIQSEAVKISGNSGYLANEAIAIQSARVSSSSGVTLNALLMLDKDDTVATAELDLDWTETSGTFLTCYANEATELTVTYIKKPASGFLLDNWVEEETATLTNTSEGALQHVKFPVLLWSYAGQIPINAQTTQKIINERGTVGSGEAYIGWHGVSGVTVPGFAVTNQATAATTCTYVKGVASDVPFTVPLEVRNAQDLSALTGVKVLMIGR